MLNRKKREGYVVLLVTALASNAVAWASSAVACSSVGMLSVVVDCIGSGVLSSG